MVALVRGIERKPFTMLIYAVAGIGKSSLAAAFPNSIVLGPENNEELNALKFPRTKTFEDFSNRLKEIENGVYQKEGIKTLVLDSIDMTEGLIHQSILRTEPGKTMVSARGGFGKAFKESWIKLEGIRDSLERIREKQKLNIVIVGHSVKIKFTDPMLGVEYDTYEMCLHKSQKNDANSIFIDWVSNVFFMNWRAFKAEDGKFAVGTDTRVLYTQYRPSHIAKNRFNMPFEIELQDTQDHTVNAGIILDYIEQFYSNGGLVNQDSQNSNQLGMLQHEVKNLVSQIKGQDQLQKMQEYYNQNENNYENLMWMKGRVSEILNS